MKLKNFLIVADDIERSKSFYRDLFGLQVIADFDSNVMLTDGLVLQERKIWEKSIEGSVTYGNHDAELFFEENDMDGFLERLRQYPQPIAYVNELTEHDWGQRVVRLYDPDRHVIEVGESPDYVARRFLRAGMSVEDTARKTRMPVDRIEWIAENMRE